MTADVIRLGFGCSGLAARLSHAESLRLVDAAYDAGIRHFDVARSYGYGRAEAALRQALAARRDEVTVTTKVGIGVPSPRVTGAGIRVARGVVQRLPALRGALRRAAAGVAHAPGRLAPEQVRADVDTSLAELGFDYVDFLLLHEATADDLRPELLDLLERLRSEGRVRSFGIATTVASSVDAIARAPAFTEVVQVPDSVLAPVDGPHPELAGRAFVHSVLRTDLATLAEPAAVAGISGDELAMQVLTAAAVAAPRATVLFSSTRPERIAAYAALNGARAADVILPGFVALLETQSRTGVAG